jgi:hypothetical protein
MCMDIICEQICKVASGFALLENLNPTLFLHSAALASFPTFINLFHKVLSPLLGLDRGFCIYLVLHDKSVWSL